LKKNLSTHGGTILNSKIGKHRTANTERRTSNDRETHAVAQEAMARQAKHTKLKMLPNPIIQISINPFCHLPSPIFHPLFYLSHCYTKNDHKKFEVFASQNTQHQYVVRNDEFTLPLKKFPIDGGTVV
jgi:hypothetical protein